MRCGLNLEMKPLVVCVDDEQDLLDALKEVCEGMDLECQTFTDAKEFLGNIGLLVPSVIVSDINMPGMDGFGLLNELQTAGIKIPFIFLTGNANRDNLRQSIVGGSFEFLTKPVSIMEFEKAVRKALAFGQIEYSEQFKEIIAKHAKHKAG